MCCQEGKAKKTREKKENIGSYSRFNLYRNTYWMIPNPKMISSEIFSSNYRVAMSAENNDFNFQKLNFA